MLKILFVVTIGAITTVAIMKWPRTPSQVEPPSAVLDHPLILESDPYMVSAPLEARKGSLRSLSSEDMLPPSVDRVPLLFQPDASRLPIAKTITHAGKVPWVRGRPVRIEDYAEHYHTSKAFIYHSLRGVNPFVEHPLTRGDCFNVLRTDHNIEFHLVLDLSRLRMWLYSFDATVGTRVLLKDYLVSAGQICHLAPSGSLTPTGVFALGDHGAVYQEGVISRRYGKEVEMISVCGKRWIPLDHEVKDGSGPCQGLSIHGIPWTKDPLSGRWTERVGGLGQYVSEGSIWVCQEDIEMLFTLIMSRPSYLHVVRDFTLACLPGVESS